jgi:hypothetical protein
MANVEAPYGLRPINLIGGQAYAGSTRQIKIESGYDTDIFFGDIVAVDAGGTIVKVEATGEDGTTNAFPAGVVGVFMGCTYTEPTLKYKLNAQYWPADTVAGDAMAYVCDDPDALFQVQADGSLDQDALGKNVSVIQNAGSTATGNSAVAADAASLADDDFLPLRVVDFVDGPFSSVGDDFTDVIVKFNFGIHSYYNGTGVAGA